MIVQCTKKLLEKIEEEAVLTIPKNPLFCWHANIITLFRKKAVILVNDNTRYTILLFGLTKNDFINFKRLVISAIEEMFIYEGITNSIVNKYFSTSPGIYYSKTGGKSPVAIMNSIVNGLYYNENDYDHSSLLQKAISKDLNTQAFQIGNNSFKPNEYFYNEMKLFFEQEIFNITAFVLKVQLVLNSQKVFRTLVVPENYTFYDLHHIIQIAFNWRNSHLHSFKIIKDNKGLVYLAHDAEDLDYLDPKKVGEISYDYDVKLSDLLKEHHDIIYNYDFGDDWEHIIHVERIQETTAYNYPKCIAGIGDTPPEDVGGKDGFDRFLKAYNDPKNKEYASTQAWASKKYQEFSIDIINVRLNGYMPI